MDGLSFATFHVPAEHKPLPHAIFTHMFTRVYMHIVCVFVIPYIQKVSISRKIRHFGYLR